MWPGRNPSGRDGWQYEEGRGPPAWPPQVVPRQDAPLQAPIPVRPSLVPGLVPAWEPQDLDPRYPVIHQQSFQSTSAPPAHPHHQYSYPVHTTTFQPRNPGSSHFHPYAQPQSRPLLFVNTVAPAPASAALSPEVLSQLKPKRKRITPVQLEALTELFDRTDSPSFDLRESLGLRLGMSNREVQVWFQNRRAKMNRLKTQVTAPEGPSRPKSSPPHPNAFASSESYSHRDDQNRVNPHQRPRTEPWSPPAATPAVADASMQAQLSSFRLPMAPPPVPLARNSAEKVEATSARDRPPSPAAEPPPPPPSRRVFAGHHINLPGRSPNLPSNYGPVSPYRASDYPFFNSPSFAIASQLGPPPSPSASSLGWPSPGWPSPAFSSSGSSLFSNGNNTDPLLSPFTPTSISSPSGTFLRLNFSPNPAGVGGSPRCESDALPSGSLAGRTASPTPTLDPASLIRLPPIVEADVETPQETAGAHRRSRSDSGPRTKLPPIQGLVDSIGLKRSPDFSLSAPDSPDDVPMALPTLERHSPPPPLPPSPYAQQRMSPAYGANRTHQRRSLRRPSSLSNILPSTEEEPALGRASRDGEGADEPLGLGMLAVASDLVEVGDGRQVLFEQARRMSYDVTANRDAQP